MAIFSICPEGSEPVDKRQTRGTWGRGERGRKEEAGATLLSLSSSMASRSSTRFSRKSAPREAWMYFLAWERVLSGLEERISSSFRKTSREAWRTGEVQITLRDLCPSACVFLH